jgi:hypothetical protein
LRAIRSIHWRRTPCNGPIALEQVRQRPLDTVAIRQAVDAG